MNDKKILSKIPEGIETNTTQKLIDIEFELNDLREQYNTLLDRELTMLQALNILIKKVNRLEEQNKK